jgi:hypothetical protein
MDAETVLSLVFVLTGTLNALKDQRSKQGMDRRSSEWTETL